MSGKKLTGQSDLRLSRSGLSTSKEKDAIRGIITSLCKMFGIVFTLGGEYFIDGRSIMNKKSCRIRSIERSKDVFDRQMKNTKTYFRSWCTNETFSKFIDHIDREPCFDLMFLDFNCIWSETIEDDLDRMFHHEFKKGSIIALTIVKGRDKEEYITDTKCVQEACCGIIDNYYKDRLSVISSTFSSIANDNGYRAKETYSTEYGNYSSEHRSNARMMFWIFKIM